MRRFKSTDHLGNVAYIHKRGNDWCCTLANGIPAGFEYAVGYCPDEMGIRFALEDAKNDLDRLRILRQVAGSNITITPC